MKKKIISSLIFVIVSFFAICGSAVAEGSDVVVSLQIGIPSMYVNGKIGNIDGSRGTTPVIADGRTLVPIRAIIEAFDGSVDWNPNTSTATLTMDEDVVSLTIGSKRAGFNGKSYTLDVAPRIINGRTMLPIRFVAESFNLAVAWDDATKTVYIIDNTFDDEDCRILSSMLPDYSGKPYAIINGNKPFFKDYEIIDASFEFYGDLDNLGRCDVAFSSVSEELMPTSDRESISSVTPSGWVNKSYDIVSGGYLYNRCHLIGYQLTGENANKRNLITGTRYLNVEGMLPFEDEVADYIDKTGGSVMYRSTPVFNGNNLVADGVLMEAYSVEDNGKGVCFCVFCYNVQPNISIDYLTGQSSLIDQNIEPPTQSTSITVYRTKTGKRYHFDKDCGGDNSYAIKLDDAIATGLTPCQKCSK